MCLPLTEVQFLHVYLAFKVVLVYINKLYNIVRPCGELNAVASPQGRRILEFCYIIIIYKINA